MEGFYTLVRRKVATDEIVETVGPFKNLITDIGLERLGTGVPIVYGYIGTGTAAAATTDTAMGVYVATNNSGTSAGTTRAAGSPYWVQNARTFRFDPAGVSRNITEVGVGWIINSTNGLWSRARTVDGSNNPVTVTVLADEYLDVTYSLRYYPPLTDSSYSVTISGTSYNFVTRLANAASSPSANVIGDYYLQGITLTSYGGAATLGAITANITGNTGSGTPGNGIAQAYVATSKSMKYLSTSGLAASNIAGGITALSGVFGGGVFAGCGFQSTVSPAIAKDATKTMTLTFSISWDRY